MNRARRIILPIVMAVILTIITCIPIFAVAKVEYYYIVEPSDLGGQRWSNDTSYTQNQLNKYYIVINDLSAQDYVYIEYYNSENGTSYSYTVRWTLNNNLFTLSFNNVNNDYSMVMVPTITNLDISDVNTLYIPIFMYNAIAYKTSSITSYAIYNSTIASTPELQRQYYELGYAQGYDIGYSNGMYDGINGDTYTNITGYVTQLLSKFVGSEYAEYLTPISIVLVILLVYFLFIRFLLSLIKAKGVIKTCDIIMIVACIILLVIMYAPKLNLTIKTEQVTTETTETTQVRRTEYIYDEYGRIISGPGGTVIYDEVESTTSEHEQTEVEVTTQPLEKEITTYEETKENIVRS